MVLTETICFLSHTEIRNTQKICTDFAVLGKFTQIFGIFRMALTEKNCFFVSRRFHGLRRECGSQGSPRHSDEIFTRKYFGLTQKYRIEERRPKWLKSKHRNCGSQVSPRYAEACDKKTSRMASTA